MLGRPVEPIQKMRAARARTLPFRPKHEAVDRERVLAGREQLREPDRPALTIELVVFRDHAARRQRPALSGDALDVPAQLHLFLQQSVPRRAIFGTLAGKVHVVDGGM